MRGLWTTKSTTRTQRRFSRYSKFHAKERSLERSPVWQSLQIFCVKLRVIEKKRLIVCVVCFRMLWELVHIEHSFWKGEQTFFSDWLWTACIWHGSLSPFSLFSYFCYQTDYKKENSIEVWTMDVQLLRINFSFEKKNPCKFQHYSELPWAFWVKWLSLLDDNAKVKKKILHSAEGGIYRWLCVDKGRSSFPARVLDWWS